MEELKINIVQHKTPGSTDTIVFLHDSLGCVALWRDFPQKMADAAHANTFIYDRWGYGNSAPFPYEHRQVNYMETEADLLMTILDKYNITNPILFGHSDGGTIALLAAAKYPAKIKAVITEGAHVFVEEETLDGIIQAKEQYRTTNLKERLEKYHGDKTQALFDAWTETWLSPAYRDWNIEHFLPQIMCPVLVVQGMEDEYGTVAQVEAIVNQVSGSADKYMVVNAGHSPHRQSELWVINQCCSFLEKHKLM
ncbi:MAG: alpha/beta hydrolase [Taibaiella sp.]|jgi:pimeloyl-ACP methyl ester carboxylesterase